MKVVAAEGKASARYEYPAADHSLRYEFIVSFFGEVGLLQSFRCFGVHALLLIVSRVHEMIHDFLCDKSLINYIYLYL